MNLMNDEVARSLEAKAQSDIDHMNRNLLIACLYGFSLQLREQTGSDWTISKVIGAVTNSPFFQPKLHTTLCKSSRLYVEELRRIIAHAITYRVAGVQLLLPEFAPKRDPSKLFWQIGETTPVQQVISGLKFLTESGIKTLADAIPATSNVSIAPEQYVDLKTLKANCKHTLQDPKAWAKVNESNWEIFKKFQEWVPTNSRLAIGICHEVVMWLGELSDVEKRMAEWCDEIILWDVCLVREFPPSGLTNTIC